MPGEVHQVGRVLPVVDGELRIEAELDGVFPEQPCADSVKGARPGKPVRHDPGLVAKRLRADPLDPLSHFGSGAAGEGHQENSPWIGPGNHELRYTMGECVGFPGARAGDDQQRPADAAIGQTDPVQDRGPLIVVQFFQMRCAHPVPPQTLGNQRCASHASVFSAGRGGPSPPKSPIDSKPEREQIMNIPEIFAVAKP